MSGTLTVLAPGNTVLTDLGRFRGPRFGLPVNGALDQFSARAANVLVGNAEHEPLLELTALDLRLKASADTLVSLTGAAALLEVGGREQPSWQPVSVRAGETVVVRGIHGGLRCYLAVHGSVEAAQLLGSCAPDTVVGFGTRVQAGTTLVLRRSVRPIRQPYFDLPLYRFPWGNDGGGHGGAPGFAPARGDHGRGAVVEVTDGPDVEEFGDSADLLFSSEYTVSPRSNHIGLRLGGALPERTTSGEVLSRGVPVGAIEVPSRTELLVLHRGRGVTAGYPVLAVATSAGLDRLAQARPGDRIRFRPTTVAEATAVSEQSRLHLDVLRRSVTAVFESLGVGGPAAWRQEQVEQYV